MKSKITMDHIRIVVEVTPSGFSAHAADYPVFTTGDDLAQLRRNTMEALQLYVDGEEECQEVDPVFEFDFQQFFQHYKVLNARFLAERIGMNPSVLSQYVRGKRKPSRKQAERILQGIHETGKDLSKVQLDF